MMVVPLNPWPVVVFVDDEKTYYGTAILADGGPEPESTTVFVIHHNTRQGKWIPVEFIEWGDTVGEAFQG